MLKIKFILGFVVLLLILVLSQTSFAQSYETGAICGTVVRGKGAPLPGVTVSISGPRLMGTRSYLTKTRGTFRFPVLPPGEYSVQAELNGYATIIYKKIRLVTTIKLSLDIKMKPARVPGEVTIVTWSPTIDTKSTETGSISLTDEILRNIPHK